MRPWCFAAAMTWRQAILNWNGPSHEHVLAVACPPSRGDAAVSGGHHTDGVVARQLILLGKFLGGICSQHLPLCFPALCIHKPRVRLGTHQRSDLVSGMHRALCAGRQGHAAGSLDVVGIVLVMIARVLEVAHVHHNSGLMLRRYFSALGDDLPKAKNFCSASAAFAAPWMSQTWLSWKLLTTLLSWQTLLMMCFVQNLAWCLWDHSACAFGIPFILSDNC